MIVALILTIAVGGITSSAQTATAAESQVAEAHAPSEALVRARAYVEKLFGESASMGCTEMVTQSILDNSGKTVYEERSLFSYHFQAAGTEPLKFTESREQLQAPYRDPGRTMLITDGFGNMLLILHPEYAASYSFEADGDEILNGIHTVKLRFESRPGADSPIMVRIRERNYAVGLHGTAWIEPQFGTVVKIIAASSSDISDLGIRRMSTEIQYLPDKAHDPRNSYWTPASAIVEVDTAKRHWRNIHRFTEYKKIQNDRTSMAAK